MNISSCPNFEWFIIPDILKNSNSCSRIKLTCRPDFKSPVGLINLTHALLQLASVYAPWLLFFSRSVDFKFSGTQSLMKTNIKCEQSPHPKTAGTGWPGIKNPFSNIYCSQLCYLEENTRVEGRDLADAPNGPFLWRSRCLMLVCDIFSCMRL